MSAPATAGTATAALQARWSEAMLGNYGVPPVALARGEGSWVWDVDGTRYLDLVGGIAVSSLGHAHPAVVRAVTRQVSTLVHTSNLAMHEPGVALAERLAALVPAPAKVFLCQDGATANEAALKIARKRGNQQGRDQIVSTHGGFHGRTAGALAVTGTPAKRTPFEPLPGGVVFVAFGDVDALRAVVGPRTAAVVVEPVQGEGGVVLPPRGLPRRSPRSVRRGRRAHGLRRGAVGHRPLRRLAHVRRRRASSPTSSRSPRAWPPACRSVR